MTVGRKFGQPPARNLVKLFTPHNSKLNRGMSLQSPSEDHGDKLSTREPKVSKGNEQVEIVFHDQ